MRYCLFIAALSFPYHPQPLVVILKPALFFAFSARYAYRFSPPSSVPLPDRPPRARALLPKVESFFVGVGPARYCTEIDVGLVSWRGHPSA